jgi:katanin p80 WD40 repeat-containing subunit B1
MWTISKKEPIMTLKEYLCDIKCVCFDNQEENIIVGLENGIIKLWDLIQQSVISIFNEHKLYCSNFDFHPFGNYFASSSLDKTLKVWDIREKNSIQTYKGHNQAIKSIRFSPDGRWIISGGEDGILQLWDLTAGKLLHEFKKHTKSVNFLEFHPHEFLLSSASIDSCIHFWDLETFQLISSVDFLNKNSKTIIGGPKVMNFSPNGTALLTAFSDSLKIWGWEPLELYDSIDIPQQIEDMNIISDQAIACSIQETCHSIWLISLKKLRPFKNNIPKNIYSSLDLNKTTNDLQKIKEDHFFLNNEESNANQFGKKKIKKIL